MLTTPLPCWCQREFSFLSPAGPQILDTDPWWLVLPGDGQTQAAARRSTQGQEAKQLPGVVLGEFGHPEPTTLT